MPLLVVRTLCATATLVCCVGFASADENRLFIIQDSSLVGGVGNTLFVDQSEASGSVITGDINASVLDQTPATQTGAGNSAQINISGVDGRVALNQTAPEGQIGNNVANIDLSGLLATGVLTQSGIGNDGSLTVSGQGASASLEQLGDNNTGFVDVTGANAVGRLVQDGDNNDTGITVAGNGANVTVTQTGNNIVTAPTVTTNGGTVIINQTQSR